MGPHQTYRMGQREVPLLPLTVMQSLLATLLVVELEDELAVLCVKVDAAVVHGPLQVGKRLEHIQERLQKHQLRH